MGYQSLLFCPDEKTARTVTQVLSELEFEVDACTETFAAVKKLMGAHFDAIVVDCDNEQNATLLFKSARNSASNHASLAVAVVEGQAGVAKAFRIGANLVLTKPINIEQAKGTLRVARGLLRKGEPGKPAPVTAAGAASSPQAEATPKPVLPPNPAVQSPKPEPTKPAATQSRPPLGSPMLRPAWPTPAASPMAGSHDSAPQNDDEGIPEILGEDSVSEQPELSPAKIAPPVPAPSPASPKIPVSGVPAAKSPTNLPLSRPTTMVGSGAASAPAPAREIQPAVPEAPAKPAPEVVSVPTEEAEIKGANQGGEAPAPSFTFGGANIPESKGGSKKILTAVASIAIVAAGGYFGWTYYQGRANTTKSVANVQPQPVSTQPAPARTIAPPATPPVSQPAASEATSASSETDTAPVAAKPSIAPTTSKPTPSTTSSASKSEPAPAPLVVKGGAGPAAKGAASVPDVAAPSVIGIGAGNSSELPPNVASNSNGVPRPLLQRMSISQGVSQGLLIKKVQPIYPKNGLSMGLEGTVELSATISKTGQITNIKVLSGDQQLAHAATEAVKQWKYKPYLLDGEPVEVQTPITIKFKLPR